MAKLKRSKKVGLPPGSLVFVGETKVEKPTITVIDYDEQRLEERAAANVEDCFHFKQTPSVTWINVDGVHDASIVQQLGAHYDIHPLTLEDILNTEQRPKKEDMGNYIYVVLKMMFFNAGHALVTEQVSLLLGANFVLTFQEQERCGDVFNFVRDRIRSGKGKLRKSGADYLLYSLIDAIVDYYFLILEDVGERVEKLEASLIADPRAEILAQLYGFKRLMLSLRRSIWPLREVVSSLDREESPLLHKTTLIYLQDVYSHAVQIIDNIEVLRETLSSMLDLYLSSVSNRLNTTMKFLTLVATIFMPLTFIAGLYGMNFKHMPELDWVYGYPFALGLMAGVVLLMLGFFKFKKWV